MKLSLMLASSLVGIACAHPRITAWGKSPWLCLIPDANSYDGTIFVKLDYCSSNPSLQIEPPSATSLSISWDRKCLEASQGEVQFKDCEGGAVQQQWQFKPSTNAATKLTGIDSPDAGQLMLMNSTMNGAVGSMNGHTCLQAGWVGQRASMVPCTDHNTNQIWVAHEQPPSDSKFLVVPSNSNHRCVGLLGDAVQAQWCTKDRVAQMFVRDGDLIHPAAGQGGYDGYTGAQPLCLDGHAGNIGIFACSGSDDQRWIFDETSGTLTTATSSDKCLICCNGDAPCSGWCNAKESCTGDVNQTFVWMDSPPTSLAMEALV